MNQARSTSSLRSSSPARKALRFALWAVIALVLVVSFRETRIDPWSLWTKRDAAIQYVFGRPLSESDRAEARRQAERLPEMMAQEDARRSIAQERQNAGKPPLDPLALSREAGIRSRDELARMDPSERERLVAREYDRVLDNKRGGYFPPETRLSRIREYVDALAQTVAIAIWGTLLAIVCAVPLSMLAAQKTLGILSPGESFAARSVRWISYVVIRRLLDGCRGFNEYVLALIIVAVIGLGPFAGVLALFVHTVGVLGKVMSDAIEAIDDSQIEGTLAAGASPLQVVSFSVIPQIMPALVSNSLLRFETNVRSATILGFVGAGGIGFLMYDKISGYQYREVCTMMIIVIVAVTLIDMMCSRLVRAVV